MKLDGAGALVTGANRGFGRHLAAELVGRGAHVYAGARDPRAVDLPGVEAIQKTSRRALAGLSGGVAALYPQLS